MKLFIFLVVLLSIPTLSHGVEWPSLNVPDQGVTYSDIAINAQNNTEYLLSNQDTLYHSLDFGKSWNKIISFADENKEIISIFFDPLDPTKCFVLTKDTLYYVNIDSTSLIDSISVEEPIFFTSCTVSKQTPLSLAIGSSEGLYLFTVEDDSLLEIEHIIQNETIIALSHHPTTNILCILSKQNFYQYDTESHTLEKSAFYCSPNNVDESAYSYSSHISFSPSTKEIIVLCSGNLSLSQDKGETFIPIFFTDEILSFVACESYALYLIATSTKIYLATIENRSLEAHTYFSLSGNITRIKQSHENDPKFFILSQNGITYKSLSELHTVKSVSPPPSLTTHDLKSLHEIIQNEPSIQKVQKAAIHYANVHNNKTLSWHRRSKLRGLLPSLTFGIDKSLDDTIDIDRGGTTDQDTYIIGPQKKNLDWGINIEWDFATLVWNEDAPAIDNRERYTFQMREGILREVNRLYFERRRKQLALLALESSEHFDLFNQYIEIDELTAHIDALTGGWFSAHIRKKDNSEYS
jgi:hypothetical protein